MGVRRGCNPKNCADSAKIERAPSERFVGPPQNSCVGSMACVSAFAGDRQLAIVAAAGLPVVAIGEDLRIG